MSEYPTKALGCTSEQRGIQVGQHTDGAIAACAADHSLHARVGPDGGEVGGAAFVFGALVAARDGQLRVEEHGVAGALERAHAAREPAWSRRVGRCDDADRVALLQGRRAEERREVSHVWRARPELACRRRRLRLRSARSRRRSRRRLAPVDWRGIALPRPAIRWRVRSALRRAVRRRAMR